MPAWRRASESREPTARWGQIHATRYQERKTLRSIYAVINDSLHTPFARLGTPEPLRENLSGFWSRGIDETNRLVYAVDEDHLTVISCRYHD